MFLLHIATTQFQVPTNLVYSRGVDKFVRVGGGARMLLSEYRQVFGCSPLNITAMDEPQILEFVLECLWMHDSSFQVNCVVIRQLKNLMHSNDHTYICRGSTLLWGKHGV